jgi:hypothetical protein
MRRTWILFAGLFLAIAGVAIGVGAYNWGYTNGVSHAGNSVQVVRYLGPGLGFFPFGFFIVPLLIFGFIFLARAILWRRPMYWGRGPRAWDRRERFQDWHDSQHDHDREPTTRD